MRIVASLILGWPDIEGEVKYTVIGDVKENEPLLDPELAYCCLRELTDSDCDVFATEARTEFIISGTTGESLFDMITFPFPFGAFDEASGNMFPVVIGSAGKSCGWKRGLVLFGKSEGGVMSGLRLVAFRLIGHFVTLNRIGLFAGGDQIFLLLVVTTIQSSLVKQKSPWLLLAVVHAKQELERLSSIPFSMLLQIHLCRRQ